MYIVLTVIDNADRHRFKSQYSRSTEDKLVTVCNIKYKTRRRDIGLCQRKTTKDKKQKKNKLVNHFRSRRPQAKERERKRENGDGKKLSASISTPSHLSN